jgi:hypothetical protein
MAICFKVSNPKCAFAALFISSTLHMVYSMTIQPSEASSMLAAAAFEPTQSNQTVFLNHEAVVLECTAANAAFLFKPVYSQASLTQGTGH